MNWRIERIDAGENQFTGSFYLSDRAQELLKPQDVADILCAVYNELRERGGAAREIAFTNSEGDELLVVDHSEDMDEGEIAPVSMGYVEEYEEVEELEEVMV